MSAEDPSTCKYDRVREEVIDLLIRQRGQNAHALEVYQLARELRERRNGDTQQFDGPLGMGFFGVPV